MPLDRLDAGAPLPAPRACSGTCPRSSSTTPARVAVSHGRAVPADAERRGRRRAGARGRAGGRGAGRATAGSGRRWCWGRRDRAACRRCPRGSTVTVGSFDGVHLGHEAVLREIARRAAAPGRASVLVTFEPHPLEVVNPQAAPPLLTTGAERREMLAQLPLDYVLFLRFDRRLASLTPEEFVRAGAARALPDARAGDRARSRLRPRPERRRRDPPPAGRRARVRRGRGRGGGRRRAARLQLADPPRRRRRRPGHRRADAGPALPGERAGGAGRAARPAARRADDQPGRACRRRSCCRPTASTPCGSSGGAAAPAG